MHDDGGNRLGAPKVCCHSVQELLLLRLPSENINTEIYRVILSVLDTRKCEYLKDYSLDFEHAYMTAYLAS